ncbi:MAG: molybdenum cofactor guanylyltransferase [Euryarchaeota archaeon]|jgi:molybdopterin-guanine dinucleotide biosynthesis protein A|nr:molybdenum cofactor guanylyltransferase [Euryarchaeota archaeon]
MKVMGLVLAGGKSSRMGVDKISLMVNGKSLLAIAVESLADCDSIIVAMGEFENPPDVSHIQRIEDDVDFSGPRAALHPATKKAIRENYDFLKLSPCDTPLVKKKTFQLLLDVSSGVDCVVPVSGDRMHPLHALVRPSPFLSALNQIEGGIHQVIKSMNHLIVEVDEKMMLNINTPRDLERAINQS